LKAGLRGGQDKYSIFVPPSEEDRESWDYADHAAWFLNRVVCANLSSNQSIFYKSKLPEDDMRWIV